MGLELGPGHRPWRCCPPGPAPEVGVGVRVRARVRLGVRVGKGSLDAQPSSRPQPQPQPQLTPQPLTDLMRVEVVLTTGGWVERGLGCRFSSRCSKDLGARGLGVHNLHTIHRSCAPPALLYRKPGLGLGPRVGVEVGGWGLGWGCHFSCCFKDLGTRGFGVHNLHTVDRSCAPTALLSRKPGLGLGPRVGVGVGVGGWGGGAVSPPAAPKTLEPEALGSTISTLFTAAVVPPP